MQNKRQLIFSIYRDKDIETIEHKIRFLGASPKIDTITFLNIRFLTTILIFFLFLWLLSYGYLLAPFIAVFYYYLFGYVLLDKPIQQRIIRLDHEALYFFEILTLTLESGRDLEHAIEVTVFHVHSEISEEFKRTLMEVKFGKSLLEALEDMKKRIPSEAINNIILNITQTSVFGNSILDTMHHQVDFLREKQILRIKGEMNKIPNRISIISVLFVVPLILLLILGPVILNLLT